MPSKKAIKILNKKGKHRVISEMPIDKSDCLCKEHIEKVVKGKKPSEYYECPKHKFEGMKKYEIFCKKCGETVAHIHATDKKLSEWCNLHTVCELKKVKTTVNKRVLKKHGENNFKYIDKKKEIEVPKWFGCLAVNISPIDQTLGFECSCGQDTRDFRASTGLKESFLKDKIKETMKGRKFGLKNSKFGLREVKNK